MKLQLNEQSKFLRAPSIRQFSNRMQHIDDCINLTIGQPDFSMPEVVKRLISKLLKTIKQHIHIIKGYLKQDRQSVSTLTINMGSIIM